MPCRNKKMKSPLFSETFYFQWIAPSHNGLLFGSFLSTRQSRFKKVWTLNFRTTALWDPTTRLSFRSTHRSVSPELQWPRFQAISCPLFGPLEVSDSKCISGNVLPVTCLSLWRCSNIIEMAEGSRGHRRLVTALPPFPGSCSYIYTRINLQLKQITWLIVAVQSSFEVGSISFNVFAQLLLWSCILLQLSWTDGFVSRYDKLHIKSSGAILCAQLVLLCGWRQFVFFFFWELSLLQAGSSLKSTKINNCNLSANSLHWY